MRHRPIGLGVQGLADAFILMGMAFDSDEAKQLNKDIFGVELRNDILHKVVTWQLAKRRAGTQKVKTRSEVHGTTKKPFAQKGTGNARQGSLKGPHQRGGGVAHAMAPRSYEYKWNKKIKALGLKTALSLKLAEKNLTVLDTAVIDSPKAKDLWNDITPMARWDWVRWVRAVKTPETRQKHIEVALDKLNKGMRRPCCFNRALCSEPAVSKNWVLLDPQ